MAVQSKQQAFGENTAVRGGRAAAPNHAVLELEGGALMRPFQSPRALLGRLDPESAAAVIAAAADIALLLSPQGVVLDFAANADVQPAIDGSTWVGRHWVDTVTSESRPKVAAMLDAKQHAGTPRWRHVNHPQADGGDLPLLYSAVRCAPLPAHSGEPMPGEVVIAFGRDMRPVAQLQQRLVDAQQAMEQDYRRLRDAQARYRLLFQASRDALLVLDANSLRVSEANVSAERLLVGAGRKLPGASFPIGFSADSSDAVQAMLVAARSSGRPGDVLARLALADGGGAGPGAEGFAVLVSASAVRLEDGPGLLVHVSPQLAQANGVAAPQALMAQMSAAAADAMVVTNADGQIQSCNPAFLEMVQLTGPDQVQGQPLDRWLGRSGVDQNVLLNNLRQRGRLLGFATTLRGEAGAECEVEISATRLGQSDAVHYGFVLRDIGRRIAGAGRSPVASAASDGRSLPRSAVELRDLVGRVPLKNIVGETTDLIEKMCIEAALELTRDNRASAAEMLGLSRQSLYVKLRRYGLGDLPSDGQPD
jgi:transcriptional regulator PpsR